MTEPTDERERFANRLRWHFNVVADEGRGSAYTSLGVENALLDFDRLAGRLADAEAHARTGWALYSDHVDRHNTERLHLQAVIAELKSLLRRACEADAREDCSFDHNGDCQAHGPWGDGEPCPYPFIRQYLADGSEVAW